MVILHSGLVEPDYKELTVNVATIFNDTGTFSSGLIGFLFTSLILTKDVKPKCEDEPTQLLN